jgi:hypothetical protein
LENSQPTIGAWSPSAYFVKDVIPAPLANHDTWNFPSEIFYPNSQHQSQGLAGNLHVNVILGISKVRGGDDWVGTTLVGMLVR